MEIVPGKPHYLLRSGSLPKAEVRPKISLSAYTYALAMDAKPRFEPFKIAAPPPGVVPAGGATLAMDSSTAGSINAWAGAYGGGYANYAYAEGQEFLGYPALALMAQRPEYRMIVDTIATEMTRGWIKFNSTGDTDKTDKIKAIEDELDRLRARDVFRKIASDDGYFGRAHLYIDTGDRDNPEELKTDLGDGRNALSKGKVKKKGIRGLKAIEAVWTYPTLYNAIDPFSDDWYRPSVWYVMGKEIHVSRLLCFIGREVPDLLKPPYSFGGLALTQLAKPYVDNWLKTRQSVCDIISAFSQFVLATDLGESLQVNGEQAFMRAAIFNSLRSNRNLLMINKDSEEFQNVSAPIGGLDALQAQAQEHMASVSGIPLVKLLGISPHGLNATAEPELRAFYDKILAFQNSFFRPNLTKVIDFVQLSLFGKIDQGVTFEFVPLWALTEKEEAELRKMDAETDQIYVDIGAVANTEVRGRLANDPESAYHGLDPDDAPNLLEEEEQGLEPEGGRPEVAAEEVEAGEPSKKAA